MFSMNDFEKEVYDKAIEVLKKCSTRHGFYAAYPGYDMVFGRDSMIISLGAGLVGNKFKNVIKKSLITLAENQSVNGQIPNAVDKFSRRKHHVDYQSIDSSLWFIIGNYAYKKGGGIFKKNIEKSLNWLACHDQKENGMLAQLPTSDWQDAFPHRYGFTINTQALYYRVLRLIGDNKKANGLKDVVNNDADTRLWNGEYYLPWRWKNHNKYQEKGEWFDSLGNLLAIIWELADKNKAEKILSYIEKHKVNKPYPVKTTWPPIKKGTKDWQDYFADSGAGIPYHYSNAGIWTYIGGVYVCALVKMKKFKEAEKQLKRLAEANMVQNFCEWLDGKTGKPSEGENQGWNAAMYIAAYESVKKKRCLI